MTTKEDVVEKLRGVQDPEIRMDIVTLGLVYDIQIREDGVYIRMTFTTPFCPYGPTLVEDIKKKVGSLEGVKRVDVEVVFDPPWRPPEEIQIVFGLSG